MWSWKGGGDRFCERPWPLYLHPPHSLVVRNLTQLEVLCLAFVRIVILFLRWVAQSFHFGVLSFSKRTQ